MPNVPLTNPAAAMKAEPASKIYANFKFGESFENAAKVHFNVSVSLFTSENPDEIIFENTSFFLNLSWICILYVIENRKNLSTNSTGYSNGQYLPNYSTISYQILNHELS